MKKKLLFTCTFAFMLLAVLAGCNNGLSGTNPPSVEPDDNSGPFIPDDINEKKLSELPADQQAEIKSLYGCYWPGGIKQQCVEAGDNKLVVYSVAMSSAYENVRWAKVSSMWICCAYGEDDTDYDPQDRRVILKFAKNEEGNLKVWQYVVRMGMKWGPFTKGKAVEKIEEGGKTYYVYDKNDSKSPKMFEPKSTSPSTAGPLVSFAFEKRINDFLDADIIGVIDQNSKTVTVTVPEAAYKKPDGQKGNRKFKASFMLSPNAKLYKGSKEQKSGETEDWFIKNKEYRVITADGSATTYALHIKINYKTPSIEPADIETVKQFFGTYRGILNFDKNKYKTFVVCDEEKFISYSLMSSLYTNMRWDKKSETEWTCTTYHKNDFARKTPSVTATFKIGTDGKIVCNQVVNAMGDAPSDDMEKGEDYIWAADDGNAFSKPVIQ